VALDALAPTAASVPAAQKIISGHDPLCSACASAQQMASSVFSFSLTDHGPKTDHIADPDRRDGLESSGAVDMCAVHAKSSSFKIATSPWML
jgi:hypothetical protein